MNYSLRVCIVRWKGVLKMNLVAGRDEDAGKGDADGGDVAQGQKHCRNRHCIRSQYAHGAESPDRREEQWQ